MSDQPQAPDAGATSAGQTRTEAQAEVQRLSSDPAFTSALLSGNAFSPAHREALGHWRALQAKAHGSGQTPAGGDESAPTKPHLTDDYVNAAAAALEAPATPDEYRISRDAPNWDSGLEGEARQLAHAIGLSNGALDGVLMSWNSAVAKINTTGPIGTEAAAAAEKETVAKLQQKHGAQASDVINKARSVINALPAKQRERAVELLEVSGLGNSQHLIEQLALLAERKAAKK